jgi:hypothetical protein
LTQPLVLLDMLQIDNLVFNGWGRRFFDSATVSLPVGAKVGLVGRNGQPLHLRMKHKAKAGSHRERQQNKKDDGAQRP